MAARLEGYTATTAVLGGNRTQKVHEWHVFSEPSETYFEFRARTNVTAAQAQAIADGVSAEIEDTLNLPGITDIAWSQDVTASGQLRGVFTVYWADPDTHTSGWVEIPYSEFSAGRAAELVLADQNPAYAPIT